MNEINEDMLRDEARVMAREALGDQAADDVLLSETTEQILRQLKDAWGIA